MAQSSRSVDLEDILGAQYHLLGNQRTKIKVLVLHGMSSKTGSDSNKSLVAGQGRGAGNHLRIGLKHPAKQVEQTFCPRCHHEPPLLGKIICGSIEQANSHVLLQTRYVREGVRMGPAVRTVRLRPLRIGLGGMTAKARLEGKDILTRLTLAGPQGHPLLPGWVTPRTSSPSDQSKKASVKEFPIPPQKVT